VELVTVELVRFEKPLQVGSKTFSQEKFAAGVCEASSMLSGLAGGAALATAVTGIGAPLAAGFASMSAIAGGVAALSC